MDPLATAELELELERCRELLAAHELVETEPGLWGPRTTPPPDLRPMLVIFGVGAVVMALAMHFGERAEARRSSLFFEE